MGTTLLAAMTTNARNDLKDLDATAYLWADSELQRHLAHAVDDYQRILPLVNAETITVLADSNGNTRRQAAGAPTGYLWAERVEYPIDHDPPAYLVFREEIAGGGSLYFAAGDPPQAGDSLKIWYAQAHTLSNGASTILQEHEELIALGAVAYAARAASRYAQNRLNASYWTPRGIQAFASEQWAHYQLWLEQLRASYGAGYVPRPQWGPMDSGWGKL